MSMEIALRFDKGTILVKGARVPNSTWDERSQSFRALAMHYKDIIDYLNASKINFADYVPDIIPCPQLRANITLRDYQKKAMDAWELRGRRGVIVLPTGSGKTIIGIKAIASMNTPALVICPTLDLVHQWRSKLKDAFNIDIGMLGGGEQDIKAITVSTYDSAYIHAGHLGNRFNFLIFDEVHHLPAEGYRQIAELFISPFRMGLTATYERDDNLHSELDRLLGGKVFEMNVKELSGAHLSPYALKKVAVRLVREERTEYEKNRGVFADYLKKSNIYLRGPADFQKIVMRSGRDPDARRALLARNAARDIALNSTSKVDALEQILKEHKDSRIFIFTEHNKLVHIISDRFLIPSITYRTGGKERTQILDGFKSGAYRAIVTSKVLDEGIDVPEADVGVILSGTGSARAFVQRLGRILRKKEGKEALLYEIVSSDTSEVGTSSRRKKSIG